MNPTGHPAERRLGAAVPVLRRYWPLPVIVTAAVAAQLVLMPRPEVGGHAAEHLASATAPFMAAAVLGVLAWTTPRALRQADVVATTGAWFAATVAILIGNLRVVDDLIAAGHATTPTGSVPDVADHSLANASTWAAQGTALVLIAAWRRRRHIGNRATALAVVATLIVPPWIIPGAGVPALALVRLAAHRDRAMAGSSGRHGGAGVGARAPGSGTSATSAP